MASIYPFLSVPVGKSSFYVLVRDNDPTDSLSQPSGLIYQLSELTYELCTNPLSIIKDLTPLMGMTITVEGNPVLSYLPGVINADIDKAVKLFKKYSVAVLADFLPREALELVVVHNVVQTGKMTLEEATKTVSLHIDKQISMEQLRALESLGYSPNKLLGTTDDKSSIVRKL